MAFAYHGTSVDRGMSILRDGELRSPLDQTLALIAGLSLPDQEKSALRQKSIQSVRDLLPEQNLEYMRQMKVFMTVDWRLAYDSAWHNERVGNGGLVLEFEFDAPINGNNVFYVQSPFSLRGSLQGISLTPKTVSRAHVFGDLLSKYSCNVSQIDAGMNKTPFS